MQLKCSRYIFTYTSSPLIVEDFILRADDLASQTYGRDKYFARLNQVLEQARFLGWPLPRFGAELPEELTEIPPPGVDHVFENQAKLLVDVAPTTQVMLEDGRYCPVKMLPGTTAAGDLVWRCHLLSDTEGTPYVQRNQKKYKVKTKGTKIVCQAETLAYDGKYVFECFGGDGGVWPVPFLPEFFSDRAIAQKFSPEEGVVEVVFIREETPVKVLAHDVVPWYRPLEINYTKALPTSEEFDSDANVGNLVDGWNDLKDNEQIVLKKSNKYSQESNLQEQTSEDDDMDSGDDEILDEESSEQATLINVIIQFTDLEKKKFKEYEKALSSSKIATKAEADKLRNDPAHKDRAEKWLVAAVNRLRIIANCSGKIGALLGLLNKFKDEQVLIIQPRQKWAAKLAQVLQQRGVECQVLDPEKSDKQISRFNDEKIKVLVAAEPQEEMFLDDIVVISVSAFDSPRWLEWLLPSQYAYCIAIKDLDLADHNFIPEHAALTVESEEYSGPAYDILKLDLEAKEEPKEEAKEEPKVVAKEISEAAAETPKVDDTKPAEVKEPKVVRPKFKIKIVGQGQGRPKTAASYEKALEMAKKHELDGKKCEIYGPEGEEPVYITGIGELDK